MSRSVIPSRKQFVNHQRPVLVPSWNRVLGVFLFPAVDRFSPHRKASDNGENPRQDSCRNMRSRFPRRREETFY